MEGPKIKEICLLRKKQRDGFKLWRSAAYEKTASYKKVLKHLCRLLYYRKTS